MAVTSNSEFSVVVPYRASDRQRERIFDWIKRRYQALFPNAQLCVGYDDSPVFNRSAARNRAAEQADCDVLLVADADSVPFVAQIDEGIARLDAGAPWVIPYEWYYNLSQRFTERVLMKPCDTEMISPWADDIEHKVESWAGLLIIPRDAFYEAGTYDERFESWGFEDNAARLALDTIVGTHERLKGYSCFHLYHPRPEGDFEQPHINHNRELYRQYEKAHGNKRAMLDLIGNR